MRSPLALAAALPLLLPGVPGSARPAGDRAPAAYHIFVATHDGEIVRTGDGCLLRNNIRKVFGIEPGPADFRGAVSGSAADLGALQHREERGPH